MAGRLSKRFPELMNKATEASEGKFAIWKFWSPDAIEAGKTNEIIGYLDKRADAQTLCSDPRASVMYGPLTERYFLGWASVE